MRYEIRVDGEMSPTMTEAFPEWESRVMAGQTVLFGQVTDAERLYGLLTRFQSLGLRVVEMRRLPE
ncbi:hypothetical protein [Streptomyces sp. NPDC005423]|uniref:hypothetical protein n=1 Tax=Streptomyces sp. NPDC005423 TaxID=3155343 RepID=UPI0033AA8EA4